MQNQQNNCGLPEINHLRADLQSPDAVRRAKAVHALCPCQCDRAVFEALRDDLKLLTKDPNDEVRAAALHVFEDALLWQDTHYLVYKGLEEDAYEGDRRLDKHRVRRPQKNWKP